MDDELTRQIRVITHLFTSLGNIGVVLGEHTTKTGDGEQSEKRKKDRKNDRNKNKGKGGSRNG